MTSGREIVSLNLLLFGQKGWDLPLLADRGQRLIKRPVGRQAFDFDGHRIFAAIGQRNRDGLLAERGARSREPR
jgi:hypothetical protein